MNTQTSITWIRTEDPIRIETGTLVHWVSATGVDTATVGKVIAYPAIAPDGIAHNEIAEIRWTDGEFDLTGLDEIVGIRNPTPEQIASVAAF
ncbi:hypothetical protein [Nocardia altamirensis]|uniref:hypothetical protein n=1 Tax=Nocardia altamirensis TaxID=472158 RepID=UPI000840237C|nr:hypothetical protein [Nocardia altamirensis]